LFWAAFTLRDHFWHNRDFSRVLAAIRFSDDRSAKEGIRYEQWDDAVASVTSSGPSFVLDIAYPIEHQAAWLQGLNPDYLVTHPTKLGHLAPYCLEHGIKLPKLRQVTTVSEVLEAEPVEACRAAWGVGVTDVYSTKESSYLALQCPEEGSYHVQSEGVLLEVLDGDRPCGPGEVGRVVVTPLHNFAMPLIREELGDYAEVGEACPCGRGLPVLKRILGRVRNLATLPTGEQFFPRLGVKRLNEIAPIELIQLGSTSRCAWSCRARSRGKRKRDSAGSSGNGSAILSNSPSLTTTRSHVAPAASSSNSVRRSPADRLDFGTHLLSAPCPLSSKVTGGSPPETPSVDIRARFDTIVVWSNRVYLNLD
jgi:hypothetical protein